MEFSLKGLFDLHVHGGPDIRVRKLTSVEVVQRAKVAEMAGVLIKCHASPTASLAAALEELEPRQGLQLAMHCRQAPEGQDRQNRVSGELAHATKNTSPPIMFK